MGSRRFTRLTNAFSKKVESHAAMVAIYTVWYNFVRIHKSLASLLRWRLGSRTSCGAWKISSPDLLLALNLARAGEGTDARRATRLPSSRTHSG